MVCHVVSNQCCCTVSDAVNSVRMQSARMLHGWMDFTGERCIRAVVQAHTLCQMISAAWNVHTVYTTNHTTHSTDTTWLPALKMPSAPGSQLSLSILAAKPSSTRSGLCTYQNVTSTIHRHERIRWQWRTIEHITSNFSLHNQLTDCAWCVVCTSKHRYRT
jgi:hypothetical protein